jgi:anti-sigma regulatory factor (Ser/Thr protein kinase)
VLGDVAGKGARAAALTALARHTLRAAERLTGDTRASLHELNAALGAEPELALCTAVVARFPRHPGRVPTVRIASAGHPRPVLIRGGRPRWVEVAGPLLGSYMDVDWTEVEVAMEPDDTLVLFTDGVLDVVGEGGERFGEERVLEALTGVRSGFAGAALAALDRAMDHFAMERARDDSAAIAVAWVGATTEWVEVVPGDKNAPSAARALLRQRVSHRLGEQEGTALLLLSELVTNAVRHGGASPEAPVRIRMAIVSGRLRIEVTDPGPGFAPEPTIEPGAHGGFGLRLLADQSDGWGVERAEGTTVWFELELEPAVAEPS